MAKKNRCPWTSIHIAQYHPTTPILFPLGSSVSPSWVFFAFTCGWQEDIRRTICSHNHHSTSIPVPSPTLAPLGDRVLVRRAAKEVVTAGGILIPADKTKDPNEGEVVAVGPGQVDVTGNLHAVSVSVGDTVLLPEYGGITIKIADDEMFLFRESDILGKFE
eukprot:CAMPEP_0119029816 /NCGR_PEP_ID=MMETSP1176-20130426/40712_1 /TAXON_ID=265551 /ORGANISM="Synedropsis recta cf, Strain CCMP1620" /LENGTH=161 /DNA_ID=CAMNT_0006986171 /DNA_START=279 /DNA_END=765 /DNA_ORIENTATION=+